MPTFQQYEYVSSDPDATPLVATGEKRKKARAPSPISNFFKPAIPEVDSKYKHGKHAIQDTPIEVTERDWRGKLRQVLKGKEKIRLPEYGRVLPSMAEWWFGHATDLMNFWPDGPGEHHPFYDQWQMARTFVHGGRVNKSLIMQAFEKDHDFYEKTMFFRRYNAIMLKNGLGLERVVTEMRGVLWGRHQEGRAPLGDKILVPEVARGGGTRTELVIPSILEAEASIVVALATISAALTVAGNSLTLPPAFLTTVATFASGLMIPTAGMAAAGGIAMIGGVGAYLMGKDSIHRIIRAARERNELDKLAKVCEQSLLVIKKEQGTCDFLRKKYGIDPDEIEVSGNALHFKEGSSSTGWVDAHKTLEEEESFRAMYLQDLVTLDHRALNPFHRRFGTVHLYEDQFLTEKGGKLVISQSGSAYEREWANRFEEMRQARNVGGNLDMKPDNKEALQMLYMQAGKSICVKIANERFSAKVLPEILRQDNEKIMRSAKQEVKKKIVALGKGTTPDQDGRERVKLKKEAVDEVSRSTALVAGVVAKDGVDAKDGLQQIKTDIETGSADSPGLFQRKTSIETTYKELATLLRGQYIVTEGNTVADTQTLASIDQAIIAVITKRDNLQTLMIDRGSTGKLRTSVQSGYLYTLSLIAKNPVYGSGKDGDSKRELAKDDALKVYNSRNATLDAELTKYTQEHTALVGLLEQLQAKRTELEKQYDALMVQRPDRERIAGRPEAMRKAYREITTGTPKVATTALLQYGSAGHQIDDYCVTLGWGVPQKDLHENRIKILLAVAEARAKQSFKILTNEDLHALPQDVHVEIANYKGKPPGVLSPEQLIVMSPHQVMAIMDAHKPPKTKWDSLKTSSEKLDRIRKAQNIEILRYDTRKKALEEVMRAHGRVVESLTKAVSKIDDDCEARIEQLVLLESVIQDRAVIYCEAPNMVRTENLRAYTDGTPVQPNSDVHSTMETAHPLGFVKFMQDVFAYHTFTNTARGETSTPRDDLEWLKKDSRDELFDSLLRSIGVPPELMLANMIVEGYGKEDFQSLLEGGILADDLTFNEVMSVIAYRHDHTLPRPTMVGGISIAQVRTDDYPVKPLEMKKILESIVVKLTKKAMAGKI